MTGIDTAAILGREPQPSAADLGDVRAYVAGRLYDKGRTIRLALACLLANGHLLIEDMPGVGKTTLAQALAKVFGLGLARIQFTSDLLPSDILGVSVYQADRARFDFRPGPIFNALVLADEINRASPRTQSALLEAMAERQVTIEGVRYTLPSPFHVIATQNPQDHQGTFALPDSQLDRFLMRIDIGYPTTRAERQLLAAEQPPPDEPPPPVALSSADLLAWQARAARVATQQALIDYLMALIQTTRNPRYFEQGLSPRAGLALRRAAQAWAWLDGRGFVTPGDVQAVLPSVVDHRLRAHDDRRCPSDVLLEHVDIR